MLTSKDSEMQDLLMECYRSTKVFAKTFMPETFCAPFSEYLHDQIFELIDSDAPRIAIAAPRGSGKTSISRAKAIQEILFRERKFIPWFSVSETGATQQTENLKRELTSNEYVKKIFGSVKSKNVGDMEESFSKKSWVAFNNTLIMPRGCGQQVRGMLYGNARPDLLIVDDLEDPNDVKSDELRAQRKDWFWADFMKCTSRYNQDWKIIYIDTLKHEDALLQDLLDASDWESIRLEICDDEGQTRAPEVMSQEELNREYVSHKEKGQLDAFYREYRNLPTAGEDASFQQSYFRYYEETDIRRQGSQIENVVIVDPAKTVKMHSDHSAIVGLGIDQQANAIYVRDIDSGMMYPDDLYNRALRMVERLRAHVLAVEVTSLNEFVTQPFKNEMARQNILWCEFIELKARGGSNAQSKEQRVRALIPYYRQGLIFHNPTCCQPLEAQLLSFPRSKLWDVMDATAYIIELLDIGDRYFTPPEEDVEAEFEDLEYEPELTDWRVA